MTLPTDTLHMTRRRMLALSASAVVLAGTSSVFGASSALAQASVSDVPMKDLMAPNALPDLVVGKADAPITVVEYASMTCGHCANFHLTTYPALKTKYIDSGKVKFILREFPLDQLAVLAFMLARFSGDDKREAVVELLFQQQKNWAFSNDPLTEMAKLMKLTGMSQEKFDACKNDRDLYKKVIEVQERGQKVFGVNATPTFFVNGKRVDQAQTIEQFDKILEPLLKS